MPLFVREGAIVPMLLTEPQTLCDANYVNNPNVKTPDSGLLFLIYPGNECHFTVYDGTDIRFQLGAGNSTATLSSVARPVDLRILGDPPSAVARDGTALAKAATPAQYDAADSAWRFDAQTRFIFIKFQHLGGTTKVTI